MRSVSSTFGLLVAAWLGSGACKLETPPAVQPEAAPPPEAPPEGPIATAPPPTPTTQDGEESGSNLEALMAAPTCDVAVGSVLKAGRAVWQGAWKISCTYEITVNGSRYKYTRVLPRDRKGEPDAVCEKNRSSMESAVKSATEQCRNMQATDRDGQGLVRIR